MATLDDNWQTKRSTICDRTRFIFNNELLSDVKFVFPASQNESERWKSQKCIPAHKFILAIMKHYSGFCLEPSLPFMHSPRQPRTGLLLRFYRFAKKSPPPPPNLMPDVIYGSWHYTRGKSDALNLTDSKPVNLHGVQHLGSEGGKYTVSLEVKDVTNRFSLVKKTGTYFSKKDETDVYYGFDVMFDQPICLEAGKAYEIVSLIKGPLWWHVTKGKESDEVQGIQFS